jgi:hypothetical protein
MLLDFRTLPCSHVSDTIRKEALGALEVEYVRFATQCVEFGNAVAAAAAAAKATTIAKATVAVAE